MALQVISRGTLRRLFQPVLLRLWFKRAAGTMKTSVGGFRLHIEPTVFHPRYFGSSAILGEFVGKMSLAGKTFLDMGTGSGVVGLFAARAGAAVTGVDVNARAVECAAANAAANGFHIEYLNSDLYSGLPSRTFDVIAWNPPFFPKPARTPAEAAWYAGPGHEVIARFARESRSYLSSQGKILIILSADVDVEAIAAMFEQEGFTVRRALSRRWGGLGEIMIVLEIQ